MANIYNSDLTKELIQGAKIQTSRDNVPNQIADKVVPVMEVNPKLLRRTNFILTANKTSNGTTVLVTTDANKDTFLTGGYLSVQKDAANDGTDVTIRVIIGGATIQILKLNFITLTADSKSIYVNFNHPIKLDRGTSISAVQTVGAGVSTMTVGLYGFTDDVTSA